jgi:serine/threonine-protein phosphatase 2A regulatory subunit B
MDRNVLTGSYSNFFHIFNLKDGNSTLLQADKSAFKAKKVGSTKNKPSSALSKKVSKREEYNNVDALDFSKKIIHASWHPRESTVALAATNNLFLFQGSN